MDAQKLNEAMCKIIELKVKLSSLDYNDAMYDDMEAELHDMEDDFLSSFGSFLEEALHEVHDEYCPDNDVLLPIAYLPNEMPVINGSSKIGNNQGVYVDADDFDSSEIKLVLVPNPVRLILNIGKEQQEVVWKIS